MEGGLLSRRATDTAGLRISKTMVVNLSNTEEREQHMADMEVAVVDMAAVEGEAYMEAGGAGWRLTLHTQVGGAAAGWTPTPPPLIQVDMEAGGVTEVRGRRNQDIRRVGRQKVCRCSKHWEVVVLFLFLRMEEEEACRSSTDLVAMVVPQGMLRSSKAAIIKGPMAMGGGAVVRAVTGAIHRSRIYRTAIPITRMLHWAVDIEHSSVSHF
jgi:hypothetical protein